MPTAERIKKIKKVIDQRQRDLVIVLEDIADPHNAAAILRTCDGLGIQKAYFIFGHEPAYNPKKIGKASSASANKWLDLKIYKSASECLQDLKKENYKIIATILDKNAKNIYQVNFLNFPKIALVVGNEHRGISSYVAEQADEKIYFPMRGMVQSFNVSVSAALFLAEIVRQRQESKQDFSLSPTEKKELWEKFYQK